MKNNYLKRFALVLGLSSVICFSGCGSSDAEQRAGKCNSSDPGRTRISSGRLLKRESCRKPNLNGHPEAFAWPEMQFNFTCPESGKIISMYTVKYDGHDYVVLLQSNGIRAVCHNENCSCKSSPAQN